VDARSALFDLYGDHLRPRGARAPVAALVRLLAPLGITAPAVRTAVSRMVRQGWLDAVRVPGGAGYELTPRAVRRLDEAAEARDR
jgi:phenylacetic acid degradation operon negative regulatory protein